MTKKEFEALVSEVGLSPIPEKFRDKVRNIVFVIEDEPNEEVRKAEGLSEQETLLGLYHGIPLSERGEQYGVGATFPDVITVYYFPTVEAGEGDALEIRRLVEETIRHEVAHYLGMDEAAVRAWEEKQGIV